MLGLTNIALAQSSNLSTLVFNLTCPGRGFISVPSSKVEPEGYNPYFIIDSKNSNFVPCYPTVQVLFNSDKFDGKYFSFLIIFLPIIYELYLTKINFWAKPFSKREWKKLVILSFLLPKIYSLIFSECVSSRAVFPSTFFIVVWAR